MIVNVEWFTYIRRLLLIIFYVAHSLEVVAFDNDINKTGFSLLAARQTRVFRHFNLGRLTYLFSKIMPFESIQMFWVDVDHKVAYLLA